MIIFCINAKPTVYNKVIDDPCSMVDTTCDIINTTQISNDDHALEEIKINKLKKIKEKKEIAYSILKNLICVMIDRTYKLKIEHVKIMTTSKWEFGVWDLHLFFYYSSTLCHQIYAIEEYILKKTPITRYILDQSIEIYKNKIKSKKVITKKEMEKLDEKYVLKYLERDNKYIERLIKDFSFVLNYEEEEEEGEEKEGKEKEGEKKESDEGEEKGKEKKKKRVSYLEYGQNTYTIYPRYKHNFIMNKTIDLNEFFRKIEGRDLELDLEDILWDVLDYRK